MVKCFGATLVKLDMIPGSDAHWGDGGEAGDGIVVLFNEACLLSDEIYVGDVGEVWVLMECRLFVL